MDSSNERKANIAVSTDGPVAAVSRDDRDLIRLGKKPVLKRTFGFLALLGFSCTVLVTWEGILIVSTQSLANGGPAGVIWGYLIVWTGTLSTFIVLSECVSMFPTAGGQYYWVSMLSPESSRNFLSYITGWVTVIGWQAITASSAYLTSTVLQGVIILTNEEYLPRPYQAMLIFWAFLAFSVFINTVTSKALARFEGLILIVHILGLVAVLVPLLYLSSHNKASFVFTTFVNYGEWPTSGVSFLVGLPAAVFSLFGADSAVHMTEEIRNAAVVVPRTILFSIVLNGAMGLAMMLGYLFCIQDLEETIASSETFLFPFIYVFKTGTGSTAGAAAMACVVVVMGICGTVGALASTSRMLWAFARDKGVPLSRILAKLNQRTAIPVYTIAATTVISMLLSLITLGSAVAFNNIVGLSVAAMYSSYFLSCILLLWRRLQPGKIQSYSQDVSQIGPDQIYWGPFCVPGIIGILNNLFACCYLALIFFWTFWPPSPVVTPQTMNFSCLTFGGTMLFAVTWYMIRGKEEYTGPIVEIEFQ